MMKQNSQVTVAGRTSSFTMGGIFIYGEEEETILEAIAKSYTLENHIYKNEVEKNGKWERILKSMANCENPCARDFGNGVCGMFRQVWKKTRQASVNNDDTALLRIHGFSLPILTCIGLGLSALVYFIY